MRKTLNPLKKVSPELICIFCASLLFFSLFSVSALAEDVTSSASITNASGKISTALASKTAETSENEKIPVIIALTDQNIAFNTADGKTKIEKDQKDLMKFLEDEKSKNKVEKIKSIRIVNAVAARVTPEVLASLAERPDVWKVELDEVISIVDGPELNSEEVEVSTPTQNVASANAWGVDKIEAPAVWQQGIRGNGILVAVVDTGIDTTHPDLDDLDDNPSTNDPKVVGWIDYVNSNSSPYDDHGHGTHVSGTISGTGAKGVNTGVAPGTKLIGAKVFDSSGSGYMSDCILAFEWAVNNKVQIISYSGGGGHDWAFTETINNVVAAGVVPVIAAGNSGSESSTVNCPGDELNSFTVGATDSSDVIAYFSSRGPVTLDGQTYIKPDFSAPGVSVTSTVPGGGYEAWDGTSMATPQVSGTVALMLERNPALTPAQIKQKLESTAVDLGSAGKDNDYGSGRINAYKAIFGNPQKPVANFTSNVTSGNAPLDVVFTDKSTGIPTTWNWSFGDGINSTQQNPTHKYSKAGNYTVVLTASNSAGSSKITKSSYIKVTSVTKPIANFTSNVTSGNVPLDVAFTDKSTGAPTAWSWSFGDGTNSTVQNPTHKYSKAGNYTVTLTASNSAGSNKITKSSYIKVKTVTKPVANFTSNVTSGYAPLNAAFTDKSSGTPTSWNWSFGDGMNSAIQNPTHAYSKAGNYTVTLTASNSAGSNKITKSSYIKVIKR